MTAQEPGVSAVAHVIQLAVAPVFLLSGVGAMLSVLTNRLARIIDRARALEDLYPSAGAERRPQMELDLRTLARRARLINQAISLCTTCALLVCAVIAALFTGAFLQADLSALVGLMFIVAMLALIGALVNFLREIQIATRSVRIGALRP
ncbi:MAG: DUF2721 domain-containing protein [Gemmatimonadales bacterium]